MEKEYKGTTGILIIKEDGVVIKRGVRGFFLGGGTLRGDKSIPYSSIVALQFKEVGFTAGYIQLTLSGGSEAKGGVFQAVRDENTITFNTKSTGKEFMEAKEIIEKKIHESKGGSKLSEVDELEKYAALRDKGVISEDEFQNKKKMILGL